MRLAQKKARRIKPGFFYNAPTIDGRMLAVFTDQMSPNIIGC